MRRVELQARVVPIERDIFGLLGTFIVEAGDPLIESTIFSGAGAETRAIEYAAERYGRLPPKQENDNA